MFAKKNLDSSLTFESLRDQKLEDLENQENDLQFLGITALEDLLQEGVFDSIEDFRNADIKLWMLTGDKKETAQNIGISSGMINSKQNK